MILKYSVSILIVSLFIGLSVEYVSTQDQPKCYSCVCPVGTTGCKKRLKASPGKLYLDGTITCLDDSDGTLKEYFFEESGYLHYSNYDKIFYSGTDSEKGPKSLESYFKIRRGSC